MPCAKHADDISVFVCNYPVIPSLWRAYSKPGSTGLPWRPSHGGPRSLRGLRKPPSPTGTLSLACYPTPPPILELSETWPFSPDGWKEDNIWYGWKRNNMLMSWRAREGKCAHLNNIWNPVWIQFVLRLQSFQKHQVKPHVCRFTSQARPHLLQPSACFLPASLFPLPL